MTHRPVKSKTFASFAWSSKTLILEAVQHNGDKWQYEGVPQGRYLRLLKVKTHGGSYTEFIRTEIEPAHRATRVTE